MKKKSSILHIVIAAAATLNLVAVLFFGYGLSARTSSVLAAERAASERAASDLAQDPESAVPGPEETAGAGSPEDDPAPESAAEGYESSSAGQPSSAEEDTAQDESYEGPSITLADTLPSLRLSELPDCVRILRDLALLSADDGYGNDISQNVTASFTAADDSLSSFALTFTVTNRRGDTAAASAQIGILETDVPYLELTEENTVLHTGDTFRFMLYVRIARDTDGGRLFDNIELDGTVDTGAAGTYSLIYTVTSRVTGARVSRTLTVTVEG